MFGRGFGWPEILLILVVVLLLFGASKLPQIGSSLGRGLREFKSGLSGNATAQEEPPTGKRPRAADKKNEGGDTKGQQH